MSKERSNLILLKLESKWLDKLSIKTDALPLDEDAFIQSVLPKVDLNKVRLSEYDL
jgi:hypothetical protein